MKTFKYKIQITDSSHIEEVLEALGRQGWDLVSSNFIGNSKRFKERLVFTLIFKQEKSD